MRDQATAQVDGTSAVSEQGKPYTVAQVAELLGVDDSTIYRQIKAGRLSALRIGSRRGTYRIMPAAFAAYLNTLAAAPEGVA